MNNGKKKIFAISGSTRKHSSNASLLKAIVERYADILDVEIYDGIDKLPHFNPDLDQEEPPSVVREFRSRIERADGVIICTPEYVFSLPGSLKNAIDWNVSTTVFSDKPVAIIVASVSGEKAFESLNLIMTTIEAKIDKDARILIKGGKGKVDKSGKIIDSDTLEKIDTLVRSLVKSIEQTKAINAK